MACDNRSNRMGTCTNCDRADSSDQGTEVAGRLPRNWARTAHDPGSQGDQDDQDDQEYRVRKTVFLLVFFAPGRISAFQAVALDRSAPSTRPICAFSPQPL